MRILVTGGAGFIGRACVSKWSDRHEIIVVDNCSREGSRMPWTCQPIRLSVNQFCRSSKYRDIEVDAVVHLAAQVAVTKSLHQPLLDLRSNVEDTLRLVLWARERSVASFVYASTNKVFGLLAGRRSPVGDSQPLAPATPYGISKAAGGLYVTDLLPGAAYDLRQSCIYGEDQTGSVDQGWVGYLARQIAAHEPVICYGDGRQVRDLLHVDDLVRLYELCLQRALPSGSYVVGGGAANAITFRECVSALGGSIDRYEEWRPADQRYFVAANDVSRYGWQPTIKASDGLDRVRRVNDLDAAPACIGENRAAGLERLGHICTQPVDSARGRD